MDLPDGGEMGYLLPIDGKRDNLFATSILMDDLKKISSMTKAKHMLFLIDACYGGLAATGARGLSSTTPNFIDKITNDKSRQIITAGGRGEQVIEKSEWGHSAFTMNLIRALENGKADLNEDGYITGDELGLFLKEKVTIDSENKQTPQSRRFTSHEGEFVFINNVNIEKQIINTSSQNDPTINYDILANKIAEKLKVVEGCTNPKARNYNPKANKDDGYCIFGKLVTSFEYGDMVWDNEFIKVPIIINNHDDLYGYQFNLEGCENIIDASGGISEEYGFEISYGKNSLIVIAYSFMGYKLPKGGKQILLYLTLESIESQICFTNLILAGEHGKSIEYSTTVYSDEDELPTNCFNVIKKD